MKLTRILLLIIFAFLLSNNSIAQKKDLLFSFCSFELPDELIQRSISFNESFSFTVDENGKPSKVNRSLGKYLTEEKVQECLGDWKFSGFSKDTPAVVLFSWKHGVGWTQTQVSSKGFYRKAVSRNSPE